MRHQRIAAWSWLLGMAGWSFAVQAADPPVEADFSYGGLQLEFTEPMRVWDNQVHRDVVRTTPALPLACHWNDDVLLLCEIKRPAEPRFATRYRIDLAPGLLTQQGKAIPAQVMHAETERPALSAYVEAWDDDGMPRFSVVGNMAMTAADVRAVLRVRIAEHDVPYANAGSGTPTREAGIASRCGSPVTSAATRVSGCTCCPDCGARRAS